MKIATLNLRHDNDRWNERFLLVVDALHGTDADVIGLQEVWLPIQQASVIADALNQRTPDRPYSVHIAPKWGDNPVEAAGILSRLPAQDSARLDLPLEPRVAQRITVEIDGQLVHIANTHLHHRPRDESVRLPQIQAALDWMFAHSAGRWLLMGDMNAVPTSETIQLAGKRLKSAHFTFHQAEPITFPTPLVTLENFPPVCLDYIFYDADAFDVKSVKVFANQPHADDATLYPSDHYGLIAELSLI
jgi:endonuclease/exonuclease/phosphatase family metal-dependent hydrolase